MSRSSIRSIPFAMSMLLITALAGACSSGIQEPDRSISVVMRDDFTYEPASIEVKAGEAIRFEVSNAGQMEHEFLIGTEKEQREFEQQMSDGGHDAHKDSGETGVSVKPGEEEAFTYLVPTRREALYFGCHQPGHYSGGMKGVLLRRATTERRPSPSR